ncbi:MAG: MarR family transcriptional regulator [Hyphomonadaceae bacterium]
MEIVQEIFDRGSMDVGELRSRLGAPKQTLARHLNDLEARGLLKRTTDVKDRRRRLVTLTQEGETFAYAQTQQRRAAIRRAFLSAGPEAVAGARGVLSAIIQDDSQT